MSQTKPFPSFERLSPIAYLHNPSPSTSSPSTSNDPDLIILATWADASPKVINVYAAQYISRFPQSRILLITSSMSAIFFLSTSNHNKLLSPALPILREAKTISSAVYSNGGAYALASLIRLSGQPLSLRGLLLDSVPGSGTDFPSGSRAILATLPAAFRRGITRCIVIALVYVIFGSYFGVLQLLRRPDPITWVRQSLLDPSVFAKTGKVTYLWSGADQIVSALAVSKHADEAGAQGRDVRREKWEGSGHVAHAKADPERYWRVVEETLRA